jgi:polyisoprenoid-binding protein YceI
VKPAIIGFVLAVVTAGVPAAAAHRAVTVDPAASDVAFRLDATGHDVAGHFRLRSGRIEFDPATGTASGDIVVDAVGAETGNKKRDKAMHGKVLESEAFPLFRFSVERVVGSVADSGRSEFELQGTLAIHGGEHPLRVPVTADVEGDRVTASTSFPVPYVEWDMHDPSILFLRVAKIVDVNVAIVGTLSEPERTGLTKGGR